MKYDAKYWQGRIEQQQKWITECGETAEGYISRMPLRTESEAIAIFEADQNELTRLKLEKENANASLSKLNKEQQSRALAELIHDKTCRSNHDDQCGWFYETWDKPGYSKKSYLEQANKILASVPFEHAYNTINLLD